MPGKFSFGNLEFEVSVGPHGAKTPREPETPFVLAVLGDFSGRSNRGVREQLRDRKVWQVDCDNFAQVFGKLRPQLRLALPDKPAEPLQLSFSTLDDFHPDRLLSQMPGLASLLEQRRRLLNPATAASAAAELQTLLSARMPQATEAQATLDTRHSTPSAQAESVADMMARLLGGAVQPSSSAPKPKTSAPAIEQMIKEAVGSSAVPTATAQQTALRSALELELAGQLRALMHQPDFQSLEATWRAVDMLVRDFGGEETIKLRLVDISKEELVGDLQSAQSLSASGLWKIIEREAQDTPWAVWLGLYSFGGQLADIETLGRLAKLAAQAQAPFISAASPIFAGCDSFAAHPDPDDWKQALSAEASEAWDALRALPEARYMGLALPRFLLRLPYGQQSEAIDSFGFEELPPDSPHEAYLWGNPATLCGWLLASAFQSESWERQAGGSGDIGELPIHSFQEDGEKKVKPCAEAWLSDRACERILSKGLIPVLSIKNRDAVRVVATPSLAGSPLAVG